VSDPSGHVCEKRVDVIPRVIDAEIPVAANWPDAAVGERDGRIQGTGKTLYAIEQLMRDASR